MTIQHARSASPYQSPVSLMVEIDERVRLFDSTGHGTLALATDLDPTSHHQVVVTLLDPGNHESTLEFEGIWVDKDAVMKQPQKQHGSVTPFSASTLPQHTIYDLSQAYTQTTQKMVEVVSPHADLSTSSGSHIVAEGSSTSAQCKSFGRINLAILPHEAFVQTSHFTIFTSALACPRRHTMPSPTASPRLPRPSFSTLAF